MRTRKDFDLLLDAYITAETKLAEADAKLLKIKFFAVKDFLRWSESLEGKTDFHQAFKEKFNESMDELEKTWEEQGVSEDLQAKFMKVHEPNTKFWLKRIMIKGVFQYDEFADATYRLLQRTLNDYNKVKVFHTFAHLHTVIGGA